MKYLLKKDEQDKGVLCDKVTIDGVDYYMSDEGYFKHNDLNVPSDFSKVSDISITKIPDLDIVNDSRNGYKKVIATNNPNIDLPKVVDEIEMDFFYWCSINGYSKNRNNDRWYDGQNYIESTQELLQLWKSQQPKVIYYEN